MGRKPAEDRDEKVELIASLVAENRYKTSYLIRPRATNEQVWIGKSICEDMGRAPAPHHLYNLFIVPKWWARKNGCLEE